MNEPIFFACTLITMLVACTSGNSKNINDADTTIVGNMQHIEIEDGEILKLTDMKLTEKEWQAVKESYNKIAHADDNWTEEDGDADMLARILNSSDISIGGKIQYYGLKQRNFKFVSDSVYIERIKYVFGIDLNIKEHLKNNKQRVYDDYMVYLIPYSKTEQHSHEGNCEFCHERRNNFFFRKYGIIFYSQPLVEIIDMKRSVDRDNVYINNDQYNNTPVYHWNNYILHGSKSSLIWLKNNGFMSSLLNLLYFFGYDKEEMINKLVLDELAEIKVGPDCQRIFAGWDIEEKLQIREGLLRTVSEFTTKEFNKYYATLAEYIRILGDESSQNGKEFRNEFSLSERRKVLAYAVNTLHPLCEKYYSDSKDTVSPIIIGVIKSNPGITSEWEQNDYYGLPNLPEVIKLIHNETK